MLSSESALESGGAETERTTPSPQQFRSQVQARKRANRFRLTEVERLEEGDYLQSARPRSDDPMRSGGAKRACSAAARSAAGTNPLVATLRMERLQLEKAFLETEWSHLSKVEALLDREISATQQSETQPPSELEMHLPSPVVPVSEKPIGKTIVSQRLHLFFDGASKSNPGESGAGWIVSKGDGNTLAYGWKYLGSSSTNNEAEYSGLIEGLSFIQRHAAAFSALEVQGDSNLVVQQVLGIWKCKSANLQPLCAKARSILDALHKKGKVSVSHIPREENGVADALSNLAVSQKSVVVNTDVQQRVDVNYLRARFAV